MARLTRFDGPAEDGQPMEVSGSRRRGKPAPLASRARRQLECRAAAEGPVWTLARPRWAATAGQSSPDADHSRCHGRQQGSGEEAYAGTPIPEHVA